MRDGQGNDDLAENSEFAGTERLRNPDVERRDLGHALIHHDYTREEGGVKQDDQLGDFIAPEINDHKRNQRDRRQRAKEIDHRIGKDARLPVPTQQEADRNRDENTHGDAEKNPPGRNVDIEQQAFMQQKFDELGSDLMRRRNQGLVDEPATAHAIPQHHRADPGREPKQETPHGISVHSVLFRPQSQLIPAKSYYK